jgi:hypothetical protein
MYLVLSIAEHVLHRDVRSWHTLFNTGTASPEGSVVAIRAGFMETIDLLNAVFIVPPEQFFLLK